MSIMKNLCPFCGYLDGLAQDSLFIHMESCRVRRFNQACNVALGALIIRDQAIDTEGASRKAIAFARALVDGIEAAAKEKGEE